MNADSVGRAPFDAAGPPYIFGPYDEREIVRNAYGVLNFKRRSRARKIANDAVDTGGDAKNDSPAFERTHPRAFSLFFLHGIKIPLWNLQFLNLVFPL